MPPSFNGKFLDAHYIVFTLLARIFFVKSTCDTKKKSFWFWFSGVSSYFPDPFFRHFKKFLHSVLNDWKFPGDKFWAIKIAVAERYWIPFIKTILCFSRWQSDTYTTQFPKSILYQDIKTETGNDWVSEFCQ